MQMQMKSRSLERAFEQTERRSEAFAAITRILIAAVMLARFAVRLDSPDVKPLS